MTLTPMLIERMLKREASISVGASTARSMGKGTVEEARNFLRSMEIKLFLANFDDAFQGILNATTTELSQSLTCRSWGAARKFLNIFLRGVLYNRYLCGHYDFQVVESFLEIPLDSHVANGLRKETGGKSRLPRWKNIIGLDQKVSTLYQEFAREVAGRPQYQVARVHLDVVYWRASHSEAVSIG